MRTRLLAAFTLFIGFVLSASAASKPAPPYQPTDDEKQQIRAKAGELASALKQLAAKKPDAALLTDVEVYHKAAEWILRYADEEFYSKRYVADTLAGLGTVETWTAAQTYTNSKLLLLGSSTGATTFTTCPAASST